MNFQADGDTNLYIGFMDNPQFSTKLSNPDDISYFTSTKEIHSSTIIESTSKRFRDDNVTVEVAFLIVSA